MSQFTDAQGRTWNIVLNVGVIRRVKAEAGIDLGGFFDEEMFTRLFISDTILVCEALCAICRPNFASHGIDEAAFYAGMLGDQVLAGRKALEEAYQDFCPSQDRERVRMTFKALATRLDEAKAQAVKVVSGLLEKDGDASGEPSGDAPASSE